MHRVDIQGPDNDGDDRVSILSEVISVLSPPEPDAPVAATRTELVQRLHTARDAFGRLQALYDAAHEGYETKLFWFYSDLLAIAQEFDPDEYLQNRAGMNLPSKRYELEDFYSLDVPEYSSIIALWDHLRNILDQVPSTDRQELVRSLEDLHEKIITVPEGQHLACERVALLTLVSIWLGLLADDTPVTPPSLQLATTTLPARHECILRLTIESQDFLKCDLAVISPSEEIEIAESPDSVRIGVKERTPVELIVKSEVSGRWDLDFALSSDVLREPVQRSFEVEFYDSEDLTYVEPVNPYPEIGPQNPFPFPSRRYVNREMMEAVEAFINAEDKSGFLVVEIRGEMGSGRNTLAYHLCRALESGSEEVVAFEQCTGDCDECRHRLQQLLESSETAQVLVVNCSEVQRIVTPEDVLPEVAAKIAETGVDKTVFLCRLSPRARVWEGEHPVFSVELEPLTDEDIRSLIDLVEYPSGQKAVLLGGLEDGEIRRRTSENLPFLHFDARVIDQILGLAANFPGLAVDACGGMVRYCSRHHRTYVSGKIAREIIDKVYRDRQISFIKAVYERMIKGADERKSVVDALAVLAGDPPHDAVQLPKLEKYLRARGVRFDPLEVLSHLKDDDIIVEERSMKYRFQNRLYLKAARDFH